MDIINGQMVGNMLDIGKETSCMIMDCILGRMVECMKDFIRKIKSMDLAFIHGLIKKDMQDGGTTENSMAWEFSSKKGVSENMAYGKMAKS